MLDDESLLSAYLDDELDPAGRLEVESALMTDPRLAEALHELAGVRELVASLPRPETSLDLAVEVGARLGLRRTLWSSRWAFPPAIAAAAVLLIALPLGWRWVVGRGAQPPVRRPLVNAGPLATPESPNPAPLVVEDERTGGPEIEEAPKSPEQEVNLVAALDDDPSVKTRAAEQEHIRRMLDSPNLHRVLIVTDVIGGHAAERVDSLLQQTPRGEPRYGRITVSQGIVIDPKHPDQATVFALVMNEQELRQLREKLEESFPDDLEETGAEPGVVTQLAEIGQVAVLTGTAGPPGVTIPAADLLALRTGAGEEAVVRSRVSPDVGPPGPDDLRRRGKAARIAEGPRRPHGQMATPEAPVGEDAAPSDAVADQPRSPGDATASRGSATSNPFSSVRESPQEVPESPAVRAVGGSPEEPSIVLVWVTVRERRGGDPSAVQRGHDTLEPRGAGG